MQKAAVSRGTGRRARAVHASMVQWRSTMDAYPAGFSLESTASQQRSSFSKQVSKASSASASPSAARGGHRRPGQVVPHCLPAGGQQGPAPEVRNVDLHRGT